MADFYSAISAGYWGFFLVAKIVRLIMGFKKIKMYCKLLQLGFLAHMELHNTGSNLVWTECVQELLVGRLLDTWPVVLIFISFWY